MGSRRSGLDQPFRFLQGEAPQSGIVPQQVDSLSLKLEHQAFSILEVLQSLVGNAQAMGGKGEITVKECAYGVGEPIRGLHLLSAQQEVVGALYFSQTVLRQSSAEQHPLPPFLRAGDAVPRHVPDLSGSWIVRRPWNREVGPDRSLQVLSVLGASVPLIIRRQ